jgi:hypothetical protein
LKKPALSINNHFRLRHRPLMAACPLTVYSVVFGVEYERRAAVAATCTSTVCAEATGCTDHETNCIHSSRKSETRDSFRGRAIILPLIGAISCHAGPLLYAQYPQDSRLDSHTSLSTRVQPGRRTSFSPLPRRSDLRWIGRGAHGHVTIVQR